MAQGKFSDDRQFLLNTGSTIEEGRLAKGGSKMTEAYTRECAVCEINSADYLAMNCPERVMVASRDGRYRVAVYARGTDTLPSGSVFMPRAIWSNVVVDPETFSTGSPLYKGCPVKVSPTDEEVLSAADLVSRHYGKR